MGEKEEKAKEKKVEYEEFQNLDPYAQEMVALYRDHQTTSMVATGSLMESSISMSESLAEQYNTVTQLNDQIQYFEHIKEVKDINIAQLEIQVAELKEIIGNFESENVKLRTQNEYSTNIIQQFMKTQNLVNIYATAISSQSQTQEQNQSMQLTIYRDLIERVEKVEKDLEENGDKYSSILDPKELATIFKELKSLDSERITTQYLKRIMNCELFRRLRTSEYITKIPQALMNLITFISIHQAT